MAIVDCGDRGVLLTLDNKRLQAWDTTTCEPLGDLPEVADAPGWSHQYISATATCLGGAGGRLLVQVSDGPGGHLQVWDVARLSPWGSRFETDAEAIALVEVDDTLIAGALTREGHVRLVDMRTGTELSRLYCAGAGPKDISRDHLAMEARAGELIVAAACGEPGGDSRKPPQAYRWTVSVRDGWRTLDSRTWRLRGRDLQDLLLHEGRVAVATTDFRLEGSRKPAHARVDHGSGCEEWTCLTSTGPSNGDRLLPTGKGPVRLIVDLGGVEAVDTSGLRTRLLHAGLHAMHPFAVTAAGPDELLLATGDFLDSEVSLWTVRLDGADTGDAEPRRFSALFGTTLSQGRAAGRDVLALADGAGVRCLDPATGRLLVWQAKRRGHYVRGSAGTPLLVSGQRPRGPNHWHVRLIGSRRRHLVLRDSPPGPARWIEPVDRDGRTVLLGVFGGRAAVWSLTGHKLGELPMEGRPRLLAHRTVAGRLYVAYHTYEHGLSVVEFPGGGTVFHKPDADVHGGMTQFRQPGGIALDDWDDEPVVAHLVPGKGIAVCGVLDGAERWSWAHGHFRDVYLHRVDGQRTAVAVGYQDTLTVIDIDGDREVARIAMGSPIQCVTPAPDGRLAVLTATGLYSLRFPALTSAAAGRSYTGSAPPRPDPPATDAWDTAPAVLLARPGNRPSRRRRGRW